MEVRAFIRLGVNVGIRTSRDEIKVQVSATLDHLPKIVDAVVLKRSGFPDIALESHLADAVSNDVEATKLVDEGYRVGLLVWSQVDETIARNQAFPFGVIVRLHREVHRVVGEECAGRLYSLLDGKVFVEPVAANWVTMNQNDILINWTSWHSLVPGSSPVLRPSLKYT